MCIVLTLSVGMIGVTNQWIRAESNAHEAMQAAIEATRAADGEKRSRTEAEHFLYIARMNTVQQAYELGDLARVRRILDTYSGPFDAGNDPRDDWPAWSAILPHCFFFCRRIRHHLAVLHARDMKFSL